MCGIAGIVSADPSRIIDPSTINRMCQVVVHRGPDDQGIFVKNGTGLGIRRLSIVDIAGGHQPIFNEDRSVWVVFNGEIYNFQELRFELENRGHRFSTNADTEVIVHLYEEIGSDCVRKLRGMFGFALYDEPRRRLLLARDRLGEKPLHYAYSQGRFLFASEIKSILAVAPELAPINNSALLQYLYFGYILDPNSAFKHIQKLRAGHLLEFERGEVRIRKYWDLPAGNTDHKTSEEECLNELQQRLKVSVRLRLAADVPLGALLSGGTDSSTVVAFMAGASPKRIKTFTIGFRNADFNETQYARVVSKAFDTEHHELLLEPDVIGTLDALTSSLEEPFGDSSMLPTYFLCQLARKEVTVVLSGDGGDELFGGYDRYRVHFQRAVFDLAPRFAQNLYRHYLFPRLPQRMPGRRLSYNASLPWKLRYVDNLSFVPAFERETSLISAEFKALTRDAGDPQDLMLQHFNDTLARDSLSQLLYVDIKTYLAADILTYVDRMSMATSLEVRTPLLDHDLVEWVTGLPSQWKIRGRKQKYILKKLAERVGVPSAALYRPKQGFSLPLVHWTRNELKDFIITVLTEARTLQRGYFEKRGIEQLLQDHFAGHRNYTGRIWRLLVFELWHRNFLERLWLG